MLEQLIKMAQERLNGISHNIPELNDLDGKQVTDVTSQTLIGTIIQQANKGDFSALREMLSGKETGNDDKVINQLKDPVSNQLQNKLNISNTYAKQLAIIALPIILNMLNKRVQNAQSGGFNVNNEMSNLNGKQGGILNSLMSMLGAKNNNSRLIDNIFQKLIK